MGRNPPPLSVQNAKEVSSTRARSWWVVQIVWGGCVRLDGASIHARVESVWGSTPMECTAASPQTADALPIVWRTGCKLEILCCLGRTRYGAETGTSRARGSAEGRAERALTFPLPRFASVDEPIFGFRTAKLCRTRYHADAGLGSAPREGGSQCVDLVADEGEHLFAPFVPGLGKGRLHALPHCLDQSRRLGEVAYAIE